MTAEALLEQFDVMAEAPNGVYNLRELVLQLAVRGKLVLQDRRDEPASALLERIATESGEPLSPTALVDAPYEVPDGWTWVRIGDAIRLVNGRAFKPAEWATGGTPIVRIQNLNDPGAAFNYCAFDVPEKFYIDDEDLLLSWSGTPGTSFGAFVWRRGRAVLNQHIFRCEIRDGAFLNDFARIAINARLDEMIAQAHGGVGLQHITKGKLDRLPIVVPPLAEQRRIVARVDELMVVCDQLEERQQRRAVLRRRANSSVMYHLIESLEDAEFAAHWRCLREQFSLLIDAPETVAELRRTVLQIAVRGRLVPQDPSDEPGPVLAARIHARRLEPGRMRRMADGDDLQPVSEQEAPFSVPASWVWVRLGQLGHWGAGATPKRGATHYYGGGIPWLKSGELPDGPVSDSEETVTDLALAECSLRLNSPGDVLIAMYGATIGKLGLLEMQATTNQAVCACTCFTGVSSRYLFYLLMAYREVFAGQGAGGAQPNISKQKIINTPAPLPPTSEQHRIVTKIEEMMRLCDTLEIRLTRAREKASHLAASVVHHLGAA